MPKEQPESQSRIAAIVILVTFPVWMALSWLGGRMGWNASYAILADLVALAAFFWAMVVLFKVWRRRRQNEE